MGLGTIFDETLLGIHLWEKRRDLSLLLNFSSDVIFCKGTFLREGWECGSGVSLLSLILKAHSQVPHNSYLESLLSLFTLFLLWISWEESVRAPIFKNCTLSHCAPPPSFVDFVHTISFNTHNKPWEAMLIIFRWGSWTFQRLSICSWSLYIACIVIYFKNLQ